MPDTFFKLLGGTDPLNQSLGLMTQGIGYPLRDVEPAISGGDVTVLVENALDTASVIDQLPAGLGVALQVLFGAPAATTWFDVDALGNITCLVTDEYTVRGIFSVGRRGGAAGVAQIYTRGLINGVATQYTSHAIIDNPDVEIPFSFETTLTLTAGDVVTFEIIRDTDANNSGGLYAGVPDVAGWASAPSARIIINRFVAVTP